MISNAILSPKKLACTFSWTPAPRARFDGVKLSGKFDRLPGKIIRATRYRRSLGPIQFPGWSQATEERVQTGVERVRRDFQNQNRLQVKVTLDRLEYHDKTNTVTPTLIIDNGPLIQVSTIGAKVSQGRLRQLIPIYQERAVDRGLLLEGSRNLVDYFQSQGYFDAAVDFKEESPSPGVQQIDYAVTRNTRHRLVGVEITGNRFSMSARFANVCRSAKPGGCAIATGVTRASCVTTTGTPSSIYIAPTDSATSKWRPPPWMTTGATRMNLGVRYEIEEGKQWTVNELTIEGVSAGDDGLSAHHYPVE